MNIIEEYSEGFMAKNEKLRLYKEKKRIVMLLAAGFSADQGYPIGKEMHENLCGLAKDQFIFDYCGGIHNAKDVNISDFDLDDINNTAYKFLVDSIKLYEEKVGEINFNYEDFYDVIDYKNNINRKDTIWRCEYREIGDSYVNDDVEYRQMIYRLPILYNQLIQFFLKDKNEMHMYEDVTCQIESYPSYANFLKFLINTSETNVIDVFTLNHDLLFESFNNVFGLEGKISDGFDDYGSEYFATMRVGGCDYRCRLKRYTGKYDAPIRLYKLHGSLDYVPFYKEIKTKTISYAIPQNYVKIKNGISPFAVEKANGCKRRYDNSLYPYNNSDFLSGTEVKIKKYDNKFLYSKLHRHFRNALNNADILIVIGYGGGDKIISEQLCSAFDYRNKQSYIIDYKPGEMVYKLRDNLDANLMVGKLNEQIKLLKI